MAEEAAELVLEGVPLVAEHYDKVYDPVKNKTKQGVEKIKTMRDKNGTYEEDDYYEYDGPPKRGNTQREKGGRDDYKRDDRRRRSGRGDLVEERRSHKESNGNARARSVGRDNRRKGIYHLSVVTPIC